MTTERNNQFHSAWDVSRLQADAQRMRAEAIADAIIATWQGLRHATGALTGLVARAAASLETRRERNRLYAELSQMTDRELADIGVARGDIASIADGTYARLQPVGLPAANIVPLRPATARTEGADEMPKAA